MDPSDVSDLAVFLSKQPKGAPAEASIRASCGRAYYAAFLQARDSLLAANFTVPKDATGHSEVIRFLKKSTDVDIRAAGSLLDQLRATRNSADYEVGRVPTKGSPFVLSRASFAVTQAKSVIEAVKNKQSSDRKLGIAP